MNIYKSTKSGSITIWAELKTGIIAKQQYWDYNISEAIRLFRSKYPARERETKGINKLNYCPFIFD